MEKTVTIYSPDGRERDVDVHTASRLVGAGKAGLGEPWLFHKPPPLNWELEKPRYRVTRNLRPAQLARYRLEPPFAECWDSDAHQYSTRPLAANEEIETTDWPHPSFLPLNYSASRVLAFFNAGMKSRMTQSPWHNGQVRLENGFSNVPGIADVRPPKPEPFNTRPAA